MFFNGKVVQIIS